MKITNARVIVCSPGRNFVTLKIETDEGLTGIGDATLNGRELSVASYLTDHIIPCLIGRDAHQIEDIWQYLYKGAYWRRGPVTMTAIAAVDTALWDLNARTAALPLYQYLGAVARDRVPAYASGGYYLPGKTPDKLAAEMAQHVSEGFRAVKMKVGLENVSGERKRIAAVREAIGDDVRLMLDANNAWRDLPTALEYMR
ncbi:enolase C-terminal domain-like protein, partial [Agrobacterium tumefaciens]|uniref:enolase C-terminal domain-like protein n=1 Tax=Agrobacterium tumefaciens TaxID=358 RepID=UPI003BA2D2C6